MQVESLYALRGVAGIGGVGVEGLWVLYRQCGLVSDGKYNCEKKYNWSSFW